MNDIRIYPRPILPGGASDPGRLHGTEKKGDNRFAGLLDDQLANQPLKFSRHAQSRMESREISLSPAELSRVENAVGLIDAKGGKDSLVLLDGNALVVSVKNHTVVTVVDRDNLKGNVFTNIDSAVIA